MSDGEQDSAAAATVRDEEDEVQEEECVEVVLSKKAEMMETGSVSPSRLQPLAGLKHCVPSIVFQP